MILVVIVTLYTSRIVLITLGVEDYGIQNVVGGFVSMFSLISSSMYTTISRFLTFELGRNDLIKLNKIFCTSLHLQVGLAFLILILAETIGIWFLNYKMNIPRERLLASNWVFQFSLISFLLSIITAPYNSLIIAHEKMTSYAYFSIIEVMLKLLAVFFLVYSSWDKLIMYSGLLMMVSFFMLSIYVLYCKRSFVECKYDFVLDKSIIKEMVNYAGWNYLGAIAYILRAQGLNILLNLFFGVTLNAARGISSQIESAVTQFVGNFTMALAPQITKSYARRDKDYMHKLVCNGSKFSFFLMLLVTIPLLFETHYILQLWLKLVPDYTVTFTRLTLLVCLFDIFSNPITTAILATGNIKKLQIILSIIMLAIFPISYILYYLGFPASACYYVWGGAVIIRLAVELPILHQLIDIPIKMYISEVIYKSIIVSVASMIVPLFVINVMDVSIWRMIILFLFSTISSIIVIYILGLSKDERLLVKNYSVSYYRHFFKYE